MTTNFWEFRKKKFFPTSKKKLEITEKMLIINIDS